MYLKSLSLKGFKSFAQKTTLDFKPGITSVVGPNGSGKSNISDAILWVLGERSAKNIRGDAMEDVIFSGTSGKSAAQMAEVTLTLDNSDGTLTLDYVDVSVTRRIYRNGENEYLLNGTPVRRMDIINILHDSGLGSGMHSVISQGSLDSILNLDSLQLRSVIEETAGILKHKERKAKSIAKLDRLQGNVDRIYDITNEVERQLKPLLKKAEKAEKYIELKKTFNKLKLETSVDDIKKVERRLKENDDRIKDMFEQERLMVAQISEINSAINSITDQIKDATIKSEEKNNKLARLKNVNDKLDSILLVLDNKVSTLNSSIANINVEKGALVAKSKNNESELKVLLEKKSSIVQDFETTKKDVDEVGDELKKLIDERTCKQEEQKQLKKAIDDLKIDILNKNEELDAKKEGLSGTRTQIDILNAKITDADLQIENAKSDLESRKSRLESLNSALLTLREEDERAQKLNLDLSIAKDNAEVMVNEAREHEMSINNQIGAIEAIFETRKDASSQAEIWFLDNVARNKLPLHKYIKADKQFEKILQYLLISELNFPVDDDASFDIGSIKDECDASSFDGNISFIRNFGKEKHAINIDKAQPISNFVEFLGNEGLIKNYLSCIYVCENVETCIDCAKKLDDFGVFITKSGDVVDTLGNVKLNVLSDTQLPGVLENERRLRDLKTSLDEAKKTTIQLASNLENATNALKDAQGKGLKLAEELARVKGDVSLCESEVNKAKTALDNSLDNKKQLLSKLENTQSLIDDTKPAIDMLECQIKEGTAKEKELDNQLEQIDVDLASITNKVDALLTKKSVLDVAFAKVEEKNSSLVQLINIKEMDISSSTERIETFDEQLSTCKADIERFEAYSAILDSLNQKSLQFLESELKGEQTSTDTKALYSELSGLRERLSSVQKEKDLLSSRSNEAKIEKAKDEIEYNTLKAVIEIDCKADLEESKNNINVSNRQALEADKHSIKSELDRLGSVDLSAKREYDALSERYAFLSKQLGDIVAATKSIKKIDAMIDERMKADFEETYRAVKRHFENNFSILFPGGKGTIDLIDDDSDNNGGIIISANPAGKRIKKMSLMSGGERSLIALGFLFALYNTRNTPFYVLDEVEAALDDTNLRRLLKFVGDMHDACQFIMITHQRRTMELSDVLFGVSMQGNGITQVITQSLESISPSLIEE